MPVYCSGNGLLLIPPEEPRKMTNYSSLLLVPFWPFQIPLKNSFL